MKLIFGDEFKFYTSSMYEICLHCHWLSFSSFKLNFGQCAFFLMTNHLSWISQGPIIAVQRDMVRIWRIWRTWRRCLSDRVNAIAEVTKDFPRLSDGPSSLSRWKPTTWKPTVKKVVTHHFYLTSGGFPGGGFPYGQTWWSIRGFWYREGRA